MILIHVDDTGKSIYAGVTLAGFSVKSGKITFVHDGRGIEIVQGKAFVLTDDAKIIDQFEVGEG